jgi:transcriptional regulator with XRE-family HTH domain
MINEDIIYQFIGKKIKELRDKKNTKQEDLAKEIGVCRASIANYESGNQAIYISDVYKIADYFGAEVNILLPSLEEVKTKSLPERLLDKAENLKEQQKKEIKEFIKKVQP